MIPLEMPSTSRYEFYLLATASRKGIFLKILMKVASKDGSSHFVRQWANGNNGYRLELRNQLVQQGNAQPFTDSRPRLTRTTGRSVDFIGTMSQGGDNEDNQHEGWCVLANDITNLN